MGRMVGIALVAEALEATVYFNALTPSPLTGGEFFIFAHSQLPSFLRRGTPKAVSLVLT